MNGKDGDKSLIQAVIFDLDGVLVTTDDCHYRAWKQMADEQGIAFDRQINERLRGVSRMASLDIILERARREYSPAEKLALATRKNDLYVELISALDERALLPGALETVSAVRKAGIKTAIGSSSKNTPLILKRMNMRTLFDAVADGNQITRSKPDPEVFLLAAKLLNIAPGDCLVVEDADAGIEAAKAGGMLALGVGAAKDHPLADIGADDLSRIDLAGMIARNAIDIHSNIHQEVSHA